MSAALSPSVTSHFPFSCTSLSLQPTFPPHHLYHLSLASAVVFLCFHFFFSPISTCNFSWISFSLDSSNRVLRAICVRTKLHYSPLHFVLLHQICRQSFVYVTTTCNLETFSLATSQSRKVLLFHPSVGMRGNSQGGLTTSWPLICHLQREKRHLPNWGGKHFGFFREGSRYEGCYSSVGWVIGEKGEITPVISFLHVQEWREAGTVGVFVGQPGCKVIRGKRLKSFVVSAVNDNMPGQGMDTWASE